VRDCLQVVFKLAIAHIGRSRPQAPAAPALARPAAGPDDPAPTPLRARSPLAGPGRPPSKPRPVTPVGRPRWTDSPA